MLTKANSAKTRTEEAQIEEEIILAYNLMQMKEGSADERLKIMETELKRQEPSVTITRDNQKLKGRYKGYSFEIDEKNKEIKLDESSEEVAHEIIGSMEDWNITEDGALGLYKGAIPYDFSLTTPTFVDKIKVTSIDSMASGGLKGSILYREDEVDSDENYNAIYNKSIKRLYISEGVNEIASESFSFSHGLTYVQLPNSLEILGGQAFYGCKNLEEIDIGSSLSYIGNYAFEECSALSLIRYNGTREQWKEIFHKDRYDLYTLENVTLEARDGNMMANDVGN